MRGIVGEHGISRIPGDGQNDCGILRRTAAGAGGNFREIVGNSGTERGVREENRQQAGWT
jgi:hypothetical protein